MNQFEVKIIIHLKNKSKENINHRIKKKNRNELYALKISEDLNITYCHCVLCINELIKQSIVTKGYERGSARNKIIRLTEKGELIVSKLEELNNLLDCSHSS